MKPWELPDDDFEEWFNDVIQSEARYRLVLPDTVFSGLGWEQAHEIASTHVELTGKQWKITSVSADGWERNYYIRENNVWVLFASIEKENAA